MPAEPRMKVYGLSLTRRRYIVIQTIAFVWMLALYGFWRHARLGASPNLFVRTFDFMLLAIYIYGVVETVVVLRKFKKLRTGNAAAEPPAKAK